MERKKTVRMVHFAVTLRKSSGKFRLNGRQDACTTVLLKAVAIRSASVSPTLAHNFLGTMLNLLKLEVLKIDLVVRIPIAKG